MADELDVTCRHSGGSCGCPAGVCYAKPDIAVDVNGVPLSYKTVKAVFDERDDAEALIRNFSNATTRLDATKRYPYSQAVERQQEWDAAREALRARLAETDALRAKVAEEHAAGFAVSAEFERMRVRAEAAEAEVARLRETLTEIRDRHIPDQPAALDIPELDYVRRQYAELRSMAWTALKGAPDA